MINRLLILFNFIIIPTSLADFDFISSNFVYKQDANLSLRVRGYHVIGAFGRSEGKFLSPSELATDPDENLYVLDTVEHTLTKFNRRGEFQWEVYGSSDVEASFIDPIDITDSDGFHLYVLDKLTKTVYQVNARGEINKLINLTFLEEPRIIKLLKSQTLLIYWNTNVIF